MYSEELEPGVAWPCVPWVQPQDEESPLRRFPPLTVLSVPHSHRQSQPTSLPIISDRRSTVQSPKVLPDRSISLGIATLHLVELSLGIDGGLCLRFDASDALNQHGLGGVEMDGQKVRDGLNLAKLAELLDRAF